MTISLPELETVIDAASNFAAISIEDLKTLFLPMGYPLIDPSHGLSWRVKSMWATRAKVEGKRDLNVVNDFIGIRIIALNMGAVLQAERRLAEWEARRGLLLVSRDDYFSSDVTAGYRAIHRDYVLAEPERWGLLPCVGVEVQITTWLQYAHNMISHALLYKGSTSIEKAEILRQMATKISEVDALLQTFENDDKMDSR
ncbi:hypothetical protein [Paraburkholderia sp. JHI869]|uniref:hypothetical protein n=1 Tax=Paraburkholderia sp. JHI869 TaxID=3112959 RepID=UPI0031791562